jgi:hypothetical protein
MRRASRTGHLGVKAYYLEPWLILGSSLFWLLVLPCAGLVLSASALTKRIYTHT